MAPADSSLARLQSLMDRSVASAGAAAADSVAYPARQMGAAEFVEFWQSVRLVAMATVSTAGGPHIAPVHARLEGTTLRMVMYDNSLRRTDIASNPQVAFTTWRGDGAAAIVYGIAREVPGSLRQASAGRSGASRQAIEIEVELTRVYAMRAPGRAV